MNVLKKEHFWVLESSQKHKAVCFVHCGLAESPVQRDTGEQEIQCGILTGTKFSLSRMGFQNSLLEVSSLESWNKLKYITDNLLLELQVPGKLWVSWQKAMDRSQPVSFPSVTTSVMSSVPSWGRSSLKTHRIQKHCVRFWKPKGDAQNKKNSIMGGRERKTVTKQKLLTCVLLTKMRENKEH